MSKDDRTVISHRLTAIGLRAIEKIAESNNIEFYDMELEAKKKFLQEHGKEIIDSCIKDGGELGLCFKDRIVLFVENEGCAGLIFTKKKQ